MTTMTDILAARRLLAPLLPATPTWSYPALTAVAGTTVHVKHENVQPAGAFKVRGGLTLLAAVPPEQRRRGVVTYSTGNHALSMAYAAAAYGMECVVVMPQRANEVKVRAVRAYGARVELSGVDLAGAERRARELARVEGLRLVGPGEEPRLVAGVGTLYVELFEAVPDLDVVVVPAGSGTGAAAAGVVAAALAPRCEVVAVGSAAAPAGHDAWRSGEATVRPVSTAVDGLATGRSFDLPQRLMRSHLADFLLVDDAEVRAAQRVMATCAHTLAEGAGAAGMAAVLCHPERFAGRSVAVVCTGGNAGPAELVALGTTP